MLLGFLYLAFSENMCFFLKNQSSAQPQRKPKTMQPTPTRIRYMGDIWAKLISDLGVGNAAAKGSDALSEEVVLEIIVVTSALESK